MTHREKLQEQYEESIFALLMDEVAEKEGHQLLAEAERLNNDPNAAIPETLDKKCKNIIQKSFQKSQQKAVKRITVKILQRVAVAVLLAALLIGAAYAAIPQFRIGVLNLMLTITDVSTGLTLIPDSGETTNSNFDSVIYNYSVPQIPNEYEMDSISEVDIARFYSYKDTFGKLIQITFLNGSTGTNMNIDTEDAQTVVNIKVNGYEGICVEKNGTLQIAWVDTDRQVFMTFYATALDFETAFEMASAMKYIVPST